ncbi:MAG: hypothetical protein V3T05_06740, partial [Myxococcota bacterium]
MTARPPICRLAVIAVTAAAAGLLPACEVQLGHVGFLWALWLVPALIAFQIFVFRRKTYLLHRFVSAEIAARVTAGVSRSRQALQAALLIAAVGLTVVALADVRYGFAWEEVKRKGVDIVLALDVSDSMLVQDA